MNNLFSKTTRTTLDVLILSFALAMAYAIRFDGIPPDHMINRLFMGMPYVVVLQYSLLHLFGVPRFAWRFFGLAEALRVLFALSCSMLVLLVLRAVAIELQAEEPLARHLLVPLGVVAADIGLGLLGITGLRMVYRLRIQRRANVSRRTNGPIELTRTLLIGAGDAGSVVAKEIAGRPDLGIVPVGFLDDDPMKHGQVIHGIPILGGSADLSKFMAKKEATQALITIASASGPAIREIVARCEAAGLPTKIIPGIYEIVGGQVNLSSIRDVAIEDLLGRAPVNLDLISIRGQLEGKVVMVTGAGGSIGAEICRQLVPFRPECLLLVEQSENSLFHIHREFMRSFPELKVVPVIADICDTNRMEGLFAGENPNIIFHAAAHKHVPMMEWNPGEAVKNNIFGTRQLADMAHAHGVEQFVMISTDKAVNPTSLMGVSKRVAEIYIQSLNQVSESSFVTVRFGNVLGSAGSVIPIFKDQIARGGPVTVTHRDMERYFMTIPEACQLVLQAGTIGEGGEIFILDMGKPVKILDLAEDLIKLSGLVVGDDIEIEFTGVRPGEKLFEELSVASEKADGTKHPKIFIGKVRHYPIEQIGLEVDELIARADVVNGVELRHALAKIVPEYTSEFLP